MIKINLKSINDTLNYLELKEKEEHIPAIQNKKIKYLDFFKSCFKMDINEELYPFLTYYNINDQYNKEDSETYFNANKIIVKYKNIIQKYDDVNNFRHKSFLLKQLFIIVNSLFHLESNTIYLTQINYIFKNNINPLINPNLFLNNICNNITNDKKKIFNVNLELYNLIKIFENKNILVCDPFDYIQ